MASQVVPVTSQPNQTLEVTVNVNGSNVTYSIELNYNTMAEYWEISLTDISTGNSVLSRVPLLYSEYPAANLLRQFTHLGLGSLFLVNAAGTSADQPTDKTLGTDFVLIWSD